MSEPGASDPEITVVRSARRVKTARWRLVDGQVTLEVPARMAGRHVEQLVAKVREQVRRRLARQELVEQRADEELLRRARELARRHVPDAVPRLRSVAWALNQGKRWGSCTHDDGTLRISDRLRRFPRFVVDYVLVHELAHLLESGHNARFHALVAAYPWAERARGFLLAADLGQLAEGPEQVTEPD